MLSFFRLDFPDTLQFCKLKNLLVKSPFKDSQLLMFLMLAEKNHNAIILHCILKNKVLELDNTRLG